MLNGPHQYTAMYVKYRQAISFVLSAHCGVNINLLFTRIDQCYRYSMIYIFKALFNSMIELSRTPTLPTGKGIAIQRVK